MSAPALTVSRQGQGVTTADQLNTYEQTCNLASDLRNFIGISGIQVYMRGQTAIDDGYQGIFYWNTGSATSDDNGVTTIVPNGSGSGAWTRLTSSVSVPYAYQVPTSGFSITIPNGVSALILSPAATLAAGIIKMPAVPLDGQIIKLSSTQTITTLTLQANTGQLIKSTITTLTANTPVGFIYNLALSTWFRY